MKIDLLALKQIENATLQDVASAISFLKQEANKAIEFEKNNHGYQNRTGNLQNSTVAVIVQAGDLIEISLEMQAEYASFVLEKGLSKLDLAEKMMEAEIESYFIGL